MLTFWWCRYPFAPPLWLDFMSSIGVELLLKQSMGERAETCDPCASQRAAGNHSGCTVNHSTGIIFLKKCCVRGGDSAPIGCDGWRELCWRSAHNEVSCRAQSEPLMVWFFPSVGQVDQMCRQSGWSFVQHCLSFTKLLQRKWISHLFLFLSCRLQSSLTSFAFLTSFSFSLFYFLCKYALHSSQRWEHPRSNAMGKKKKTFPVPDFFYYPWCFWASSPETLMLPKSEELPLLCVHPALRRVLLNSTLTFIKEVGKWCPDLAYALNIQLPTLITQWVILENIVIIKMALSMWPSTHWDSQCVVQPLP